MPLHHGPLSRFRPSTKFRIAHSHDLGTRPFQPNTCVCQVTGARLAGSKAVNLIGPSSYVRTDLGCGSKRAPAAPGNGVLQHCLPSQGSGTAVQSLGALCSVDPPGSQHVKWKVCRSWLLFPRNTKRLVLAVDHIMCTTALVSSANPTTLIRLVRDSTIAVLR